MTLVAEYLCECDSCSTEGWWEDADAFVCPQCSSTIKEIVDYTECLEPRG